MSYVLIKGKYKCTVCEISAKNVFIKTIFLWKLDLMSRKMVGGANYNIIDYLWNSLSTSHT